MGHTIDVGSSIATLGVTGASFTMLFLIDAFLGAASFLIDFFLAASLGSPALGGAVVDALPAIVSRILLATLNA